MKLKVFISWSGDRSRQLAHELSWWLPRVVHGTKPWMSEVDIQKGERWSEQIGRQLKDHDIGILCVTPENTASEWLLFEAGALSKMFGEGRVCPVLLGIRPGDLDGPLSQFQATVFERDEVLALAKTLNTALGEDRSEDQVLLDAFEKFWPELERRVQTLAKLEVGSISVPQVVKMFAKYGLPEPRIGSSVYFAGGYESHVVYETACVNATRRLYVFGRKNRKLFDKEHEAFFRSLPSRVSSGFDFRCLFLDPAAPQHVISAAHEDSDFSDQLSSAIQRALGVMRAAGLDPDSHCRTYRIQRSVTAIVVDDALLYTHIRLTPGGRTTRLTKCPFSVVNAHSPFGEELVGEFTELWEQGGRLSSAVAVA